MIIDHIQVECHLNFILGFLERLNRLTGGDLIRECKEIRVHDTARCLLIVAQEILHLLSFFGLEQLHDLLTVLFRKGTDEIGGII